MSWKKTLAAVAPTVATALGGPFGGMAAKMALDAFGVTEPQGDPEKALEGLVTSGNPEVLVRLKEVETGFKQRLAELEIDLEEIHQRDRHSARDLAKNRGTLPQSILSTLYMLGFLGVLYAVFKTNVPQDMREPLMYLLGILSAGLGQIMNFWFGSSSGSKDKTQGMIRG